MLVPQRELVFLFSFFLNQLSHFKQLKVAGVEGFEPSHHGIKTRCLTAWLHPNNLHKLQKCHSEDEERVCQDGSVLIKLF